MAELWVHGFSGEDLKLGESIAIDGACLTVAEVKPGAFKVEASPETLRRTTIGSLEPGGQVNLERALALGDRLGGHLVLGHVDAVCQILSIREEGGSRLMGFSLPPSLAPMFVEKGSVALDGISLTVNEIGIDRFFVAIIPETLKRTTLGSKPSGSAVNVEADLIGKYIARLYTLGRAGPGGSAGIAGEILPAVGFGPRG
jgi:riboflavin synthase